MGPVEWAAQVVVALLLLITLYYAVRLERALRIVRQDRAAYEELVGSLRESARLVDEGILRLRAAAETASRDLTAQVNPAQTLANDLSFLIERAEQAATRLEALAAEPPVEADRRPQAEAIGTDEVGSRQGSAPPRAPRAGALTDLQRITRMGMGGPI